MTDRERHLDEALCRLPVPAKLQASLAPEALFDDAAIDRLISRVAVPSGLTGRVRQAVHAGPGGRRSGVVDLSRFQTPAPGRRSIVPAIASDDPRRGRRGQGLTGVVREASSVAAALGLVILLATTGVQISSRLAGPTAGTGVVVVAAPSTHSAPAGPWGRQRVRGMPAFSTDPQGVGSPQATAGLGAGAIAKQPAESKHFEDTVSPLPSGSLLAETDRPPQVGDSPDLPPRTADALGVRGAPVRGISQPGMALLATVGMPKDTRRVVPRSPAYDLAFEMAHGESPFIAPAADQALAVDRPPLSLETASFDTLLFDGVLPGGLGLRARSRTGEVRAEEILAAMPPPPALTGSAGGDVRLGMHALRSGRMVGGKPTVFLEVAAFAAGPALRPNRPLSTTLILDQSAAGDRRAWPRICRGLAAVASRLEETARVSVVLCGGRPRLAIRDADPVALAEAAANWEALPPVAFSDLDAALELARAEGLLERRTVVVAHAATLDGGRDIVREMVSAWHQTLALSDGDSLASDSADGLRLVTIDPAAPSPGHEPAAAFGRTSLDATAIRRDLVRQVTGRNTLVARQCRLEVRFDPRQVAGYRILGHRQSAVASLADGPPEAIDLHAGETLRVVYEVLPQGRYATDSPPLAKASLSWRLPDGSMASIETADMGPEEDRTAPLPSPHGCEILFAAALGELAGGSAHQSQPRGVALQLEKLAEQWQLRGDITLFGEALIRVLDRRND